MEMSTNVPMSMPLSVDPWDWRTDAPEFVPSAASGLQDSPEDSAGGVEQSGQHMTPVRGLANQAMGSPGGGAPMNSQMMSNGMMSSNGMGSQMMSNGMSSNGAMMGSNGGGMISNGSPPGASMMSNGTMSQPMLGQAQMLPMQGQSSQMMPGAQGQMGMPMMNGVSSQGMPAQGMAGQGMNGQMNGQSSGMQTQQGMQGQGMRMPPQQGMPIQSQGGAPDPRYQGQAYSSNGSQSAYERLQAENAQLRAQARCYAMVVLKAGLQLPAYDERGNPLYDRELAEDVRRPQPERRPDYDRRDYYAGYSDPRKGKGKGEHDGRDGRDPRWAPDARDMNGGKGKGDSKGWADRGYPPRDYGRDGYGRRDF